MKRFLLLILWLASLPCAGAGTIEFMKHTDQAEQFQTKAFDTKTLDFPQIQPKDANLGATSFQTKNSDLMKSANWDEKEYKTPQLLSFNQIYDTKTVGWARQAAAESGKTSSMELKNSSYGSMAKPEGFDTAYQTSFYNGPEADRMHKELKQVNDGLGRTKNLPNRPLTIEEVKNLLNKDRSPDPDAGVPTKTGADIPLNQLPMH